MVLEELKLKPNKPLTIVGLRLRSGLSLITSYTFLVKATDSKFIAKGA